MFASMVARVSKKSRPHAGAGVPWRGPSRFSGARRSYVYGSYVDEPLLMKTPVDRFYYSSNHLYSVAAITDQSGQVVERYKYDAYGRQGILASNGVVSYSPSDYGQFVGFTGRYHDWETGLVYFRARYFDASLGRFIGRDPMGHTDGASLYAAYFSPNGRDPSGQWNESGHFYTVYMVARSAGFSHADALKMAQFAQYPDENPKYDAIDGLLNENRLDIQRKIHSLTGGDPTTYREKLKCLLKNKSISMEEAGILLHSFGDTFSHTYESWSYGSEGSGKTAVRTIEKGPEVSFTFPFGHMASGHGPDYIANNKTKYIDYVRSMYMMMRQMNPGGHGDMKFLDSITEAVLNMKYESIGFEAQNALEIGAVLRAGGDAGIRYDESYRPEKSKPGALPFPATGWEDWGGGKMKALLEKISADTCCGQ